MLSTHRHGIAAFARLTFLLMTLITFRQPVHAQDNALARFPVAHEHSSGWCMGYLYVYADSISYEVNWPVFDREHSFKLRISDLQQIGRWNMSGQKLNAVELKSRQATYRLWWIANEQDVISGRPYQFNPPDAGDPDFLIAAIRNPESLNANNTPTSPALPELQQPVANAQTAPSVSESRYSVTHMHAVSTCAGYLYVSPTRIRFEVVQPEADKKHSFDLSRREITSVQQWVLLGNVMNAAEIKTARGGTYRFWLLSDTADIERTPPKQWGNPQPVATLIAALRGQPAATASGAPTASNGPGNGAYTNYPTAPAGAPAPQPSNVPAPTFPTPMTSSTQGRLPILRFDDPVGFYHSAITPPDDYSSSQFNASLQVYPFRPFNGDIARLFKTTLLRDWIDPRFQEAQVVGQPEFRTGSFPGAQFTISAKFVENNVGIPKTRLRWLIVAGTAAALVDMSASDPSVWQRFLPQMDEWFKTLRVDTGATPRITQNLGPAAQALAGLYMALVYQPRAYVTSALAAHYYLFSADGRVYRKYDDLTVPGGDPNRFDFDAAERADSVNSGRYSLDGNRVRIQMGRQGSEIINITLPENGSFKIGNAEYTRQ
jgi:hypothetical protein